MAAANLTAARLRELLHYDPETGVFTRHVATGRHGRHKIGTHPGCESEGHLLIWLDGRLHAAGRLVWLYMTGEWPAFDVDHKDGCGTNNRWKNLRDIPHAHNIQNRTRLNKNNTSGFTGVVWNKRRQRWIVTVKVNRKVTHLGTFGGLLDAAAASLSGRRRLHPGCTA